MKTVLLLLSPGLLVGMWAVVASFTSNPVTSAVFFSLIVAALVSAERIRRRE